VGFQKKVYHGGMSILSILLVIDPGCHTVNPSDPKEIEFSNEDIQIQASVIIDLEASLQNF
jgi:hypothetical protein